jgi:Protein of unknown function (DUF2806)
MGAALADPNAIINIGELAKPANTLVEKIADAIGGIAKPWQIKRVAEAEAEANRIRAMSEIEITDLQQRAMRRFFMEEAKKQNNIETIISKALPEVSKDAKVEEVEDDWIANFFDKCRLISDEEMQKLWARVLAGEANSHGKFSRRTVDLLASLDKSDAGLFSEFCRFNFDLDTPTPLIYDVQDAIYNEHGLTFMSLSHLDTIGLIQFNDLVGYIRPGCPPNGYVLYCGQQIYIEFPNPSHCQLSLGKAVLTVAGSQLAPLCNGQPVSGFVEYVKQKWTALGYKIEHEN